MVPAAQVPLVKGDPHPPAAPGHPDDLLRGPDSVLHVASAQHTVDITTRVVLLPQGIPIAMDGHHIQVFARFAQEVERPIHVGHRRGQEHDGRVGALHHLGRLAHKPPPLRYRLGTHLPAEVILVADGPVTHVVRLGEPIRLAQPRPASLPWQVTVLHPVAHLLGRAGARVGADIGLCSDQPAPGDKLVRAERVRLFHAPGLVVARQALAAHPILPVVGAHKTSARPAHNGHTQFAHRLRHIPAQAALVGQRRPRLENTAVHLAVKMLQELPKEHRAVGPGAAARIDGYHPG